MPAAGRSNTLAKGLRKTFALLTSLPLVITLLMLAAVGSNQTSTTVKTVQSIQARAIRESGERLQEVGRTSVKEVSTQTEASSIRAIHEFGDRLAKGEGESLSRAAEAYSQSVNSTLAQAVRQSQDASGSTLKFVSADVGKVVDQS